MAASDIAIFSGCVIIATNVSGGGKKKEELADFGRILTTWQF